MEKGHHYTLGRSRRGFWGTLLGLYERNNGYETDDA